MKVEMYIFSRFSRAATDTTLLNFLSILLLYVRTCIYYAATTFLFLPEKDENDKERIIT